MLRRLKALENYEMRARDGKIGLIHDFYFDDKHWVLRYVVVDTIGFLSGRQILVSPLAFKVLDWKARRFNLTLTRNKVNKSPPLDLSEPITQRYEEEYFQYYEWPFYWSFGGEVLNPQGTSSDYQLRSANRVAGNHVQARDGEIGHVEDFIVDDETWAIRYLVVDGRNWWLERKVLVAPFWVQGVSWANNSVSVKLSREMIKNSPEWRADVPVGRDYEKRLHDYYGQSGYWRDEATERTG